MYACFKKIPKKVRQQAYEEFVNGNPNDGRAFRGENFFSRAVIDENIYCPIGAVNRVVRDNSTGEPEFVVFERLPHSSVERRILRHTLGVDVDLLDIQRFIEHVDEGKINTPEKLARAMGVKYNKPVLAE